MKEIKKTEWYVMADSYLNKNKCRCYYNWNSWGPAGYDFILIELGALIK